MDKKQKIKNFIHNFWHVFGNFPLACLFAVALTVFMSVYVVQYPNNRIDAPVYLLAWSCGAVMLFTFSADLFAHLLKLSLMRAWLCDNGTPSPAEKPPFDS